MKTAPNALRMPELFFISFLRLPQRCKYSATAEYEKYERAEIRLEGNLHTKYEAAARHRIPVTGTAGCINNVGTLGIHLVK